MPRQTQVFGVTRAQEARLQQLIEVARQFFFDTQFNLRLVPNIYQSAVYLLLFGGLALIYTVDRQRAWRHWVSSFCCSSAPERMETRRRTPTR